MMSYMTDIQFFHLMLHDAPLSEDLKNDRKKNKTKYRQEQKGGGAK